MRKDYSMDRKSALVLIWFVSSLLAAMLALEFTHATYLDGVWHPVSNDSFYHARRILDAIDSDRGFYQFDEMIHAPEGSWLTWPWAYDWCMAQFVKVWQFFNPAMDSMEIITHVAVYWIFVNAALLLGITVVLNLPTSMSAMVLLGFALLPTTQNLHGVGLIDHHYVELSFVLAMLLSGLAWLKHPDRANRAIVLGITLGIAPAFHTGLFIIQAPVLLTLFLLWVQKKTPPKESMLALSCALTLAMLAALLPSEPFLQGQFQFSVLSWFHLYIAASSTLFIACMARFEFSAKALLGLIILGLVLLLPIWEDTIGGSAFLTKKIAMMDTISEARSPFMMMQGGVGFWPTVGYYSIYGLLIPLLIPLYLYRGWKADNGKDLLLAVMIVFGTSLLLTQYRLNYFGGFAILIGWLVPLSEKFPQLKHWPKAVTSIGIVLIIIGAYPSIKYNLFLRYPLGWDEGYEESLPLFEALAERCTENPGIALVDNNFGHITRYSTDCSVIANNFLMTPQHEAKVAEMWDYFLMTPEELLEKKPEEMRYVFARLSNYLKSRDKNTASLVPAENLEDRNLPLPYQLLSRDDLPKRYKLIAELPLFDKPHIDRARIFEILPEQAAE
jgi:asparagine N-glycosylation enzyme membrane subunit Stt3